MPEMPQLKTFPYDTSTRCSVCHPAKLDEPPFMQVRAERTHAGTTVQRDLVCPNCGASDVDLFDQRTQSVVFNRKLENDSLFPKVGNKQ